MGNLKDLKPFEIIVLGTTIAIELGKCRNKEEIIVIKRILSQISCSLSMYIC